MLEQVLNLDAIDSLSVISDLVIVLGVLFLLFQKFSKKNIEVEKKDE